MSKPSFGLQSMLLHRVIPILGFRFLVGSKLDLRQRVGQFRQVVAVGLFTTAFGIPSEQTSVVLHRVR
jgi:hypothetical protein